MVVNPGKNEIIEAEGKEYRRLCIKTHVITDADKITDVVMQYAAPEMQEGDILFITDINDIGGVIMGEAPLSVDRGLMAAILRDNPLGQSHEQTPMGIIRPVA